MYIIGTFRDENYEEVHLVVNHRLTKEEKEMLGIDMGIGIPYIEIVGHKVLMKVAKYINEKTGKKLIRGKLVDQEIWENKSTRVLNGDRNYKVVTVIGADKVIETASFEGIGGVKSVFNRVEKICKSRGVKIQAVLIKESETTVQEENTIKLDAMAAFEDDRVSLNAFRDGLSVNQELKEILQDPDLDTKMSIINKYMDYKGGLIDNTEHFTFKI